MTARQEVHVGDIAAGGDVTVNPSQTVVAQGGATQPEWAEALLRGPIDALELGSAVTRAGQQADGGEHLEAAAGLLEIAAALTAAGYGSASDVYLEQGAVQLDAAGDRAGALSVVLEVARGRLARGDDHLDEAAERAARLVGDGEDWIPGALEAICGWPEIVPEQVGLLREGVLRAAGRDDEIWWAANAVEILSLAGRFPEALELANPIAARLPLSGDMRLTLEFDRLEALEEVEGAERAEPGWDDLLQWAGQLHVRRPEETGHVWQRRAVALAERDDLDGAHDASLQAIQAWSRVPGHQDQAAEAFFTYRAARHLLGAPPTDDHDVAAFAAELRGTFETATARAGRLQLAGLNARLEDQQPEARRKLLLALREHRRAGDLRGQLAACAVLAELHEHAGLHSGALAMRIACGHVEHAERLARGLAPPDLMPMLALHGPRWQRAASYAAFAVKALEVPPAELATPARVAIDEAETDPPTPWGSDPVYRARLAAMQTLFVDEDDLRQRVLSLAQRSITTGWPQQRRQAALTLLMATQTGLMDASGLLVDDYLAEVGSGAVISLTVADLVRTRPVLRDRLRVAALEGSRPALEALAVADAIGGDDQLVGRCAEIVNAGLEVVTHTDDGRERSVGLISFEDSGIIGRACSDELRSALAAKLIEVITDLGDLELNRASAANALLNLAPAVPESEAERSLAALEPLAHGRYEPSQWDADHAASLHPFSRFRFGLLLPQELRATALRAFGRVAEGRDGLQERLVAAVEPALIAAPPRVMAAALDVLARHPNLPEPVPVTIGFENNDVEVRLGALKAHVARHGLPHGELLERLLADPDRRVRLALRAGAARERDHALLARLRSDPDAYVRALASVAASNGGDANTSAAGAP